MHGEASLFGEFFTMYLEATTKHFRIVRQSANIPQRSCSPFVPRIPYVADHIMTGEELSVAVDHPTNQDAPVP